MNFRHLLYFSALLVIAGCDGDSDEGGDEAEGCLTDIEFFQQQVSIPILEKDCISCHNAQGEARNSNLVLASPGETNYLQENFRTLKELAALERDGTSLILLKPTLRIAHQGGQRFDEDSDKFDIFAELVDRFDEPVSCDDEEGSDVLDKILVLDLPETLRKAKVQLVGELPSPEELDRVATEGIPALDELILGYLEEDAFYDVLKRWYNDRLLTNKYLGGNRATDLLSEEDFPARYYYNEVDEETQEGRAVRRHSNNSVAREPLELIAHVVRNDRPFSEILTADYMLLNPFSARVYGASHPGSDPLDAHDWREVKLTKIPHAGILTSPMFLNRFPTTDTNRNRHRSRVVWDLFLATDILRLADRPVDPTNIRDHNPTMNNPQCTVCHTTLDPIAGAFQNWTAQGRYIPPDGGWFPEMLPPGFGENPVPPDEWGASLRWLAKTIVADERFALSAVTAVYTGLVGRPPMLNPPDDDPRFAEKLEFFNLEQAFLRETVEAFVASDYNLKTVVLEVVRSTYYRAFSAIGLDDSERVALEPLGTMRLLTPEELNGRLVATLGYPWKRRTGDGNFLLERNEYLYFYGGIDSDNVTARITEPNGIMANIALRMANEMGCLVTPRDFRKARADRLLFPHVEASYRPEDDNGFEIPDAVAAIKRNIRHLHARLLGEVLSPDHEQVEATYQLYLATWREGFAAVQNEQVSRDLPGPCRAVRDFYTDEDLPEAERLVRDPTYAVRAWSAVMTYLLADWRYLYHQ